MPSAEFVAKRLSTWPTNGPQGPVTLEIYPTLRCNLDCSFCDTTDRHRPPQNELSTEEWLRVIDEAAAEGVVQAFVLGGGEPMIRNDIMVLLERIKHHGMRGMLTTNGTLLGRPRIKQLLELQWDELHLSIDGATPQTHDKLRGKKRAFKKALTAACTINVLKRRRRLNNPQLVFHTVVNNQNHLELRDIVELANAVGVSRIDFDRLIAYRPEQLALQLSAAQEKELRESAAQALQRAQQLGIQTTLAQFTSASSAQRGSEDAAPQADAEHQGMAGAPCLKAWHHLVLQADGRSAPCCVLTGQGESIHNRPLRELWQQDPFLNRVRDGMENHRPLKRCQECSANILSGERSIRQALQAVRARSTVLAK